MAQIHSKAARLFHRQALFATQLANLLGEESEDWKTIADTTRAALWPEDQLFSIEQVDKAFLLQQILENEFLSNGGSVDETLALMRELLE